MELWKCLPDCTAGKRTGYHKRILRSRRLGYYRTDWSVQWCTGRMLLRIQTWFQSSGCSSLWRSLSERIQRSTGKRMPLWKWWRTVDQTGYRSSRKWWSKGYPWSVRGNWQLWRTSGTHECWSGNPQSKQRCSNLRSQRQRSTVCGNLWSGK